MVVMMMIHANCCLIFAAICLLDVIKVLVVESLEAGRKGGNVFVLCVYGVIGTLPSRLNVAHFAPFCVRSSRKDALQLQAICF